MRALYSLLGAAPSKGARMPRTIAIATSVRHPEEASSARPRARRRGSTAVGTGTSRRKTMGKPGDGPVTLGKPGVAGPGQMRSRPEPPQRTGSRGRQATMGANPSGFDSAPAPVASSGLPHPPQRDWSTAGGSPAAHREAGIVDAAKVIGRQRIDTVSEAGNGFDLAASLAPRA